MASVEVFFFGRDPKGIQIRFTKFISLPPKIFVVAMAIIMAAKYLLKRAPRQQKEKNVKNEKNA